MGNPRTSDHRQTKGGRKETFLPLIFPNRTTARERKQSHTKDAASANKPTMDYNYTDLQSAGDKRLKASCKHQTTYLRIRRPSKVGFALAADIDALFNLFGSVLSLPPYCVGKLPLASFFGFFFFFARIRTYVEEIDCCWYRKLSNKVSAPKLGTPMGRRKKGREPWKIFQSIWPLAPSFRPRRPLKAEG